MQYLLGTCNVAFGNKVTFFSYHDPTITIRVMQNPPVVQNDFTLLLHISKYLSLLPLWSCMLLNCNTIFSLERNVLWEAIENQSDVQKLHWNVVGSQQDKYAIEKFKTFQNN